MAAHKKDIQEAAQKLHAIAEGRPDRTMPRSELIHEADKLGVSERTLQRHVENLRGEKLTRPPKFHFTEWLAALVLAYGKGRMADLYTDLLTSQAEHGLQLPSYSTFWRNWKDDPLFQRYRAYVEDGLDGVRRALVYVRFSAKERNQMWQADICALDIKIRIMSGGKIVEKRPYIVAFIDDHTRMIMGWTLCLDRVTSLDVLNAFVDAAMMKTGPGGILFGGLAAAILWDNGLELNNKLMFVSLMKAGVTSWAAQPWVGSSDKGKIERWFQTLQLSVLSDAPGYMKDPSTRNRQVHAKVDDLLDMEELHAKIKAFVNYYNFERPHSALEGQTPFERWTANTNTLKTVDLADLLRLVPEEAMRRRKVNKDGILHEKTSYVSIDPWFDRLPDTVQTWYPPSDASPIGRPTRLEILVKGGWKGTAKSQDDLTSDEVRHLNQFQDDEISYFEDLARHKQRLKNLAKKYPNGRGGNNLVKAQLELDLQYGDSE